MSNPKPKLENLTPFPRVGSEPLAEKQVQVRLPVSIDAAVQELGNKKTEWLRRVITEAAKRELMTNSNGNQPHS